MNTPKSKQAIREEAESMIKSKDNKISKNLEKFSLHETQKIVHELEVHQIELELQNEELLRTQAKLEKTKKRYFDLYDMAPIGYCTLNKDGLIEEVNLAMSDLLGRNRNKLIKHPFSKFILPEDQDIYYLHRKNILASQEQEECELRVLKADNTSCWVYLSAVAETNKVRLVIKDISKRKKLEKDLSDKEEIMLAQSKQAAMGDMIAMIAHQWRQPITVIGMEANNINMNILLEEEITTEELKKMADSITEQTQQLSQTIDDFRNFFKPKQEKVQATVGSVLESTLKIVGKSMENNNIVVMIENRSETEILTYPNELLQVLLNLLGNAKDILLDKEVSDAKIIITIDETQDSIVTKICDNGGGIPKNAIKRLGEPYYTTKEKRTGTGLGLYMSITIVEKHLKGSLTWENRDEGACFIVSLPKE